MVCEVDVSVALDGMTRSDDDDQRGEGEDGDRGCASSHHTSSTDIHDDPNKHSDVR
jgi:hypothetical protein